MTRRFVTWLVLLVCLGLYFGLLTILAAVSPIDTGEDIADLTLSGILRGGL